MAEHIMKLSLVGAGPGDPELITLKAVRILGEADVILYDALANAELLQYASPSCEKIFVGKRRGCHSLSQQEINNLILEKARQLGHVVRLKGGDPFVFGRAQEEMEVAAKAGMCIEVIPGISSAIAIPEINHIPLTCRGIAESFWITTGTTRSGEISHDIHLAAQSTATVVLLMAMSKLEAIMALFSSFGKKATAVAIIQNGSTPQEKMIVGTVNDITIKAEAEGFTNPAIIIIGDVVKYRQQYMAQFTHLNPAAIQPPHTSL